MIMPDGWDRSHTIVKSIDDRIDRYYGAGWIKNSSIGDNDLACDLFSHPENYVPVLRKYPKLKICLAHMGGSDEISYMSSDPSPEQKKILDKDGNNWASLLKELMKEHLSLYTDISYSLAELHDKVVLKEIKDWINTLDQDGQPLVERILFGTDFYMTEQENKESELYRIAKQQLGSYFNIISENSRYF